MENTTTTKTEMLKGTLAKLFPSVSVGTIDKLPDTDLSAIERALSKRPIDNGWQSLITYCVTNAARSIIRQIHHIKWHNRNH